MSNPQAWNRFSYVANRPVNFSDPTGHREISGCSELAGGCNVKQETIDDDLRKENEFRQTTERNKCKAGNKLYCSYAENHPVETAIFGVGGLLLAGTGSVAVSTITLTAEAATTTTITTEVANTACGGDMCTGELNELSRVFHSGRGAQIVADAWARTHNAVTLNQTETGAELNQILEAAGYNVMRPFAEAASAEWAVGASGPVNVFLKLPLSPNNIWGTFEYPALWVNDAVKVIINFIE